MSDQTPRTPETPDVEPASGSTAPARGWRGLENKTRIGAVAAGVALCGFGFLGGIAVGSASADDGGVDGGPGNAPGMGQFPGGQDGQRDGGPGYGPGSGQDNGQEGQRGPGGMRMPDRHGPDCDGDHDQQAPDGDAPQAPSGGTDSASSVSGLTTLVG